MGAESVKDFPWNEAKTLEQVFLELLNEGNQETAILLMKSLPEILKSKYRTLYKDWTIGGERPCKALKGQVR